MELFTNHYTGVQGYARVMPLPEDVLLIGGELITDISKELLRITSRPKIISIKNPTRGRNPINKISHSGASKPIKSKASEQWRIIEVFRHGVTTISDEHKLSPQPCSLDALSAERS